MTDSEKVAAIRQALGITQQEFAEKLGMSQQAVSHMENGRNEEMSIVMFKRLVKVFQINPNYILSEKAEKEPIFLPLKSTAVRAKLAKYEKLIAQLYEAMRSNASP